jgi:hypothetical protein
MPRTPGIPGIPGIGAARPTKGELGVAGTMRSRTRLGGFVTASGGCWSMRMEATPPSAEMVVQSVSKKDSIGSSGASAARRPHDRLCRYLS